MRFFDIDAEHLINLVKERPSLWDQSDQEYKARTKIGPVWREVCSELDKEFVWLSENDKIECIRHIMKKWRNLKDTWLRSRRHGEAGNVYRANQKKPYIHSNLMQFLKKNKGDNHTTPNILPVRPPEIIQRDEIIQEAPSCYLPPVETHEIQTETYGSPRKSHQKSTELSETTTELYERLTKTHALPTELYERPTKAHDRRTELYETPTKHHERPTETNNSPARDTLKQPSDIETFRNRVLHTLETPENRHLSFFKGILPSLHGFSEEEILQFQMGVLNAVQNIRRSKSQPIQHEHYNMFHLNAPPAINHLLPSNRNSSQGRTDSPNSDSTQMQTIKVEEFNCM